ncbi:MAG: type III-B CRISPR module-associated protein Cmr5 [Candidatus Micrarchaeia archaeon]
MDVTEFALSFINEVMKEDNETKGAFRSRARELYSMAYFDGILPTLAFIYSKAKEENVKNMLKGIQVQMKDKSYALYLVSIIRYLKEIENIKDIDGSIDSIFNKIKENEVLLSSKIFILLNWLKLFSEAKIRSD